jgi:hypothetical protein
MAFDPNLPANGSLASSAELRAQFNALKAEIDELRALLDTRTAEILSNSAAPVTNVNELNIPLSDPLTQSDGLQLMDKVNEMLNTLKRA